MPSLSPIRTIFPFKCGAGSLNGLAWRMVWSYHSQDSSLIGVERVRGSWFFVLVTLSPTVVGALSVQLTQLNSPFLPSAVFRGLPRCWRVCQHRYHFFIFSHFILSTSYSTARSLPVKELSTLTSGGRKIGTVADSLPRIRKTGLLPGRSRRTISMERY